MQTAELRTTGRKEGSYWKLLRMCMILIKTLVFLRIINEISKKYKKNKNHIYVVRIEDQPRTILDPNLLKISDNSGFSPPCTCRLIRYFLNAHIFSDSGQTKFTKSISCC